MKVIRYVQKVESGKIVIENFEKYSGKDVEVVIIPLESFKDTSLRKQAVSSVSDIFGMFKHRI